MTRDRSAFLLITIVLIGIGLLSRSAIGLPLFFAKYAGSIIWGAMVYFAWAVVCPRRDWRERAIVTALMAIIVELSQLWHTAWLDAFRRTAVGVLLIGRTFSWVDILCYLIGIAVAVVVERCALRVAAS